MTIRAYDLSIISDQEAADRLGVMAAEREDLFDQLQDPAENEWLFGRSEEEIKGYSANRTTGALDILALRKAQVALTELEDLKRQLALFKGLAGVVEMGPG